jgi:hypothetical protein
MSPTLSLFGVFTASSHHGCCSCPLPSFFLLWHVSDVHIYIYIYLHMLMYKEKNYSLTFLHPHIPGCCEMGFCAWIDPTALLRRGVPSEAHHDCILSMKGCRVTLDGGFIDLHDQDRDSMVMKLFIRL